MTEFVLILTIIQGYPSSIEAIDGFTDRMVCEVAGREWKSSVRGDAFFVCIEKK